MIKYTFLKYIYNEFNKFNKFNNKYILIITICICILFIFYLYNVFFKYNSSIEDFRNRVDDPEQHINFDDIINNYGDEGIESIRNELNNFIKKNVFEPVEYDELVNNNIINDSNTIKSFIFARIKPNGELKSRLIGYVDKHNPIKKKLSILYRTKYRTSPIKIQTIRLQLNIASFEKRILTNLDVKSAYLNADLPTPYYMKIKSELATILCDIDPIYQKYLTDDGTLYVKVTKAIYGLYESSYLWYKNLTENLEKIGYKISQFDMSFMYHPVNKTQLSIYVDDILISATDQKYITELINHLTECYGELNIPSTVEDEINYIGLLIKKYINKNKNIIKINQPKLITKNLLNFQQSNILKIPYDDKLFINDKKLFHNNEKINIISRLRAIMYVAQRTRPDIAFPIYYLLKNHKNNYNPALNINNIYSYIKDTPDLGILLKPRNLNIYGWVDINEFNQLIIIISFGKKKASLIYYSIKQLDVNHYFYENDEYGKDINFKNSFNIINSNKLKKKIINNSFINILLIKKFMEELGYYHNKITIYLNNNNIKQMNNLLDLINNADIINNMDFTYIEGDKMLTNILSNKLQYKEFNIKRQRIF
jgi:virulence-associated protein VapD